MNNTLSSFKKKFYLTLFGFTFVAIFVYLIVRITLVLQSNFTWAEAIFAAIFLFAESFILIHSLGYFLNIFRVISITSSFTPYLPEVKLQTFPPIAVILASYKEPLDILKDTLVCFYNLSYPNKYLYFLDDTRYDQPWDTDENKLKYKLAIEELCKSLDVNLFRSKWHGAKAGKINDFLKFLDGKNLEGFEYFPFGKKQPSEPIKYVVIFDADMNPLPNFAEDLVSMMEKKSRAAFTQTPQYYTNFAFNRVAWAAGLQQAIFYEYICEGKDHQGAMFCCGTNVIFRREALNEVGGFDETSVTEDFATSLKFHKLGWESVYLNRVAAFGMGPEDLGSFFKQQFRWARGTLGILRTLPKELLLNFKKFTINQWWEYFLASTHYLIGLVFFIMVIFPLFYLFFNIPSYIADPFVYLSAFMPYISLTLVLFIWTLKKRKYQASEIASVLLMNAVAYPVFIKAAFSALFGIKSSFGVTPKEGSSALPLRYLSFQIITALACVAGVTWGFLRLYYEREPFYGILLNIIWTIYNFLMISTFLYFNHSEREQ